ncbi:MAG: sensor domain-containing diguanylate cyclase [Eubacteriales bacterium]|nr:sensor domain-containing diguanylate cyclase [Eubacteriales bacterium]
MPRTRTFITKMIPPVAIILITVVMSVSAYGSILQMEKEKCWGILENTAATINNEIMVRFKDNVTILKLAANAMVQENRVEFYGAITKHINAFQAMTIFSRIDVLYPDDTVLLQTGARVNVGNQVSFAEIAAKGEHMSPRAVDFQSGNEAVYYTVPVVSEGVTQALMIGVIECGAMPELFKARAYDGEAFSCLIDVRDGSFIMDDWHDTLGNMYEMKPREQLRGYENVDLIEDVRQAKTGVTAYKSAKNGQNSYMYYTPVGIFDWELLIVVQEQVAFASLLKLESTLFTLAIVEAILLLLYFIWTFITVNQLEKNRQEIEEKRHAFEVLSYHDTLTALYNRNKYNETAEEYQKQGVVNMGVAFLDLNGLKQVNDEQGHEVGDALIYNTAKQIRLVFPEQAFRIGGDEFVVLAAGIGQSEFAEKMGAVQRALKESRIDISIGCAWKSEVGNLTELLKAADEKMYEEKRKYYESGVGNRDRRGKRYI